MKWKNNENRKPLILQGARQVGKTWILKRFGEIEYYNYVYINFDLEQNIDEIFRNGLDPKKIIKNISLLKDIQVLENEKIGYWKNDSSSTEVDFVYDYNNSIIPIEVKSGKNTKAKSLKSYLDKYNPEVAIKTSLLEYKENKQLIDIPLMSINILAEVLNKKIKK